MMTPMLHQLVPGVVYTQSSVYQNLNPADYAGMNSGTADASQNNNETGCNSSDIPQWVQADCGSTILVHHVTLGYDYLNNLGANFGQGWGPGRLAGAVLQGSTDGSTWTDIMTIPDYDSSGSTDGELAIVVDTDYQYMRVSKEDVWLALTEFEIWTAVDDTFAPAAGAYPGLMTPCSVQDLRVWIQNWDALCAGVESQAAIFSNAQGLYIVYPYTITTDASLVYDQAARSYTLTTPCSVRRLRVGLTRWDAARPGAETQAVITSGDLTLTATFPP